MDDHRSQREDEPGRGGAAPEEDREHPGRAPEDEPGEPGAEGRSKSPNTDKLPIEPADDQSPLGDTDQHSAS